MHISLAINNEVKMIKLIISGASGFMGQVVTNIAKEDKDVHVVCGVDTFPDRFENAFPVYDSYDKVVEKADVIIDFSRPEALDSILDYAQKTQTAAVLCTTGYSKQEQAKVDQAAKTCVLFQSANMSLGVNIQMDLIKQVAGFLGYEYNVEIIEKHHNRKVDAPSGTALALADCLNEAYSEDMNYVCGRHTRTDKRDKIDIGIHAVRGGTVVGEHEVLFLGNDEVIEVSHRALSRQVFAVGAVRAAKFIVGKPAKMYEMKDILSHHHVITNMYFDQKQAMITVSDLPSDPSTIADVFEKLALSGVNIDIITQNIASNDHATISFSLSSDEINKAKSAIKEFVKSFDHADLSIKEDITKITVEGMGMERQTGVAAKLFKALSKDDIAVKAISTSETKIAFCVKSEKSQSAMSIVSKAFNI
jgi:4-hydroxy-tetrahydrodipicolinate reductase